MLARRWLQPRTLIVAGLAIIALSLLALVVRVSVNARDIQSRLSAVESLAQTDGNVDVAQLHDHLSAVKGDLAAIRADAGWLLPLAPLFGWLPQIGGDVAYAPELFNLAESLVTAADAAFDGWSPMLDLISARGGATSSAPITEHMLAPLVANRVRFVQAKAALDEAASYRARIDTTRLSPRVVSLVRRVDRIQPLAQLGAEGALLLPDLLGANGTRTYLLVAQNEDELRATGGFVSAVGRLSFDYGKIVELEFGDSYQVDNVAAPLPPPPAPLQQYMLAGAWVFRDANWSPDFPTSAQQLAHLYELGQGKKVDGVIALDQHAVRALVAAVGPVTIEGSSAAVSADNLVEFMRAAWTPALGAAVGEAWLARKNFIGALAKALQAQVLNGGRLNAPSLARALYGEVRERHLMFFVADASLRAPLARLGWDGALRAAERDFLLVVDSNLGFNKANALVAESFDFAVTIAPDRKAQASLSIHYQHTGKPNGQACVQRVPDYGPGLTYDALMNACLWDYLRVYAPQGSTLVDGSRYPIAAANLLSGKAAPGAPEALTPEMGKAVFANFFFVERGSAREVRLAYDLPSSVLRAMGDGTWQYALVWQKQAGTNAIPATLSVTLPPGAALVRATAMAGVPPKMAESTDGVRVTYTLSLSTDVEAEIIFRQSR